MEPKTLFDIVGEKVIREKLNDDIVEKLGELAFNINKIYVVNIHFPDNEHVAIGCYTTLEKAVETCLDYIISRIRERDYNYVDDFIPYMYIEVVTPNQVLLESESGMYNDRIIYSFLEKHLICYTYHSSFDITPLLTWDYNRRIDNFTYEYYCEMKTYHHPYDHLTASWDGFDWSSETGPQFYQDKWKEIDAFNKYSEPVDTDTDE